ncbi:MaoC-like domain [Macleaya cordata]|uniref:MaoC-like domain n=1 Tax=Macleaya cordata TaxID=56857 RepID=A0A200QFS7_MACCD|nr:MaoC-like domain [Macleaya cordata]
MLEICFLGGVDRILGLRFRFGVLQVDITYRFTESSIYSNLRDTMKSPRFHETMLLKRLVSNFMPSLSFTSLSSEPCVLKIGDLLRKSRNFSDQDVLDYSKLSHDLNPMHFDSKCAQDAGFKDRIVHGMLVASLFPQIIASHFPGAVYVSQSLHFKLPVYIGEEVVAQIQALNIRENKKRYIAKFATKCFKNGELLVLDGEAVALLPSH